MSERTFKIQDPFGIVLEVTERETSFFDELRKEYASRKEFSVFDGTLKAPSLNDLKKLLLTF